MQASRDGEAQKKITTIMLLLLRKVCFLTPLILNSVNSDSACHCKVGTSQDMSCRLDKEVGEGQLVILPLTFRCRLCLLRLQGTNQRKGR